ncbi:Ig-like domain-containing protein [Salinimicrobium sp. TH3]|uniref:Ig-like domain-containing protein n=1 Tax=Salinimicrobium sp. TH3 TaxID=2997342 RepID=UPI002274FBF7|nr:Ig-like domain-containing protein [Salinimicrobium sp. TH3]MCY2686340.1 Ig-like domain-containing protein [Salinimicrobium sp. TH3]
MKELKKLLFLSSLLLVLGCSTEDDSGGGVTPPVEPPVEELPVAVDDEFSTAENTSVKISGLMDNDTVFEYARITEIDNETEAGGEVTANNDGSYTYTPPQDFMGEDSFEYTICDNAATKNCSTATVNITITASSPTAVDDTYETQEEKILKIINHLSNDDLADNAEVTSIGVEGTSGTVVLESDGDILYTPEDGFVGEDSFTYNLCDDDEEPTCSTATITVMVIDEGSPVAKNDEVVVEVGATGVVFSNLLDNDDLIDDAVLTSIDATGSKGSVVLNDDGTITYGTTTSLEGEDRFTYTICDDDETATCSTATVRVLIVQPIALNIPAELQDYYSGATLSQDPVLLKTELAELTEDKHVNKLEYYMRHDYLYDADASFSDPEYVVLMYTGDLRHWTEYQEGDVSEGETFNTEHIYPQSKLASSEAKNDMHHMRASDIEINETRSNYPFTDGSGEAKLVNENSWYPGDEWKGDVARMVMYVHLKYGEPFSDVGTLEMFLEWNAEDPVSAFEIQRQEIIEGAQGNRNPFIDNPYFATLIWGGPKAENLWD